VRLFNLSASSWSDVTYVTLCVFFCLPFRPVIASLFLCNHESVTLVVKWCALAQPKRRSGVWLSNGSRLIYFDPFHGLAVVVHDAFSANVASSTGFMEAVRSLSKALFLINS
jgi:hypothetical protein